MVNLRPFLTDDRKNILDILTDRTLGKTYMLPDFETRDNAIPLFNRLLELSEDPNRFVRCIALGSTAIGFLNDVEINADMVELGYAIHPDFQGHGYMTQALKQAIAQLFEQGYRCILCGAFEENTASIRVMEKSGMSRINRTEIIEYREKVHNCVFYQCLANEDRT